MAYERINWVSKKTKLSARNFNHMEDGIAANDAAIGLLQGDIEIIDEQKQDKLVAGSNIKNINGESIVGLGNIVTPQGTVTSIIAGNGLTGGAISRSGTIAIDETKVAMKEDVEGLQEELVSGVNIKTINSKSLLGPGNIDIQGGGASEYVEIDDPVKLDDLMDGGVYKLSNVTDAPDQTSNNGLLDVRELTDGKIRQDWMSSTNRAVRVAKLEAEERNIFYITKNNEARYKADQGTINLVTGNTYILEGDLIGNIVVSGSTEHLTRIILKGAHIQSSELTAISFNSAATGEQSNYKNVIELYADTDNYLEVNTTVTTDEEVDPGTLHAEDDLTIVGTGYLSIKNNKGHGIRASKLKFNGEPHITIINAAHDGIHGGKELMIAGGNYKIVNAGVDAVSHSGGSTGDGNMLITGGKFNVLACVESAFESKTETGFKKIVCDANITIASTITNCFKDVDVYEGTTISCSQSITKKVLASDYSTPSVTFKDAETSAVTVITPTEAGVYVLDKAEDSGLYTASGNFANKFIQINAQKARVILNGVYHFAEDDTSFIKYTPTGKNMRIDNAAGSINYIQVKYGHCIESGKNFHIGGEGHLIVRSDEAEAIYAPFGDLILLGDGINYINNSETGIVANYLVFGENPGKGQKVHGLPQFTNNELDIYLPTKLDSSSNIVAGSLEVNQYLSGGVVLKTVTDEGENPSSLTDLPGKCYAKFDTSEYINKPCLSIRDTAILDVENVQSPVWVKEYADDSIEPLIPGEGKGNWKVYAVPTNVYTKDEVDAAFVKIADYEAKIEELTEINDTQNKILKKLQKTEDRLAPTLYSSYPKLVYTLGTNILESYVVRGNKGEISNPIWTQNNTTYAYHKNGQGYEYDATATTETSDSQFNLVVKIPEGKAVVLTPSYDGEQPYKNLTYSPYVQGEVEVKDMYRVQATKVVGSFNLTIEAKASYKVTYKNGDAYHFSDDSKEVPTVIAEGNSLVFKFFHLSTEQKPGQEPTAAQTLDKIEYIKIDDVAIELEESFVITDPGKKKATIKVPASKITGNIEVKLK